MGVLSTAVARFLATDAYHGAPALADALLVTRRTQSAALGLAGTLKSILSPLRRNEIDVVLSILDRAALPGRDPADVRNDFLVARQGLSKILAKSPEPIVSTLLARDIAICSLALNDQLRAVIELQESVEALCAEIATIRRDLDHIRAEIILALKLEAKEFEHHKTLAIVAVPFGEFYLVGKAIWDRARKASGSSTPAAPAKPSSRPRSAIDQYYEALNSLPANAPWKRVDDILAARKRSVGGASATMAISSFISRSDAESIKTLLDRRKTVEASLKFCTDMELEMVGMMESLLQTDAVMSIPRRR